MNLFDIKNAGQRIDPYIRKAPVARSPYLDGLSGGSVFLKCENRQITGSFKLRGATNALLSLLESGQRPRGVVTRSSGNHGRALAHAARRQNVPCHIIMPENATSTKIKAVKQDGASLELCALDPESRERAVQKWVQEEGFTFIHSHDDERVIAGQGTSTMEFLEEVPDLDLILAPLGGGGLLAGTALAAKSVNPYIKVIGVEPETANDGYLSLKEGHIVKKINPPTMADGLRTHVGEANFPIIRKHVDDILLVKEQEILESVFMIYDKLDMVIEPSSAVAVAALFFGKLDARGKRIGIIVSGGNLDIKRFSRNISRRVQESVSA
jgi:threonine dehydratase